MNISIYLIPLGFDQGYIIQGEGVIMIDGGEPKKSRAFIKGIKKLL